MIKFNGIDIEAISMMSLERSLYIFDQISYNVLVPLALGGTPAGPQERTE